MSLCSIKRHRDWQARLDAILNRSDAFQYGSWDCCLFACDAVEAMTGVDPAAMFRGKYSSRAGALRAVKAAFGRASVRAVAEGVTALLSMPECSAKQARRGDVVLIKRPRDYSLGIVDLTGAFVAVLAAEGVERIPLSQAFKVWHV